VNGGSGSDEVLGEDEEAIQGLPGAMRMIGAARAEAAKLLREELADVGIDVCEVVVGEQLYGAREQKLTSAGPMASRLGRAQQSSRPGSDDSSSSSSSRKRILEGAFAK